MYPFPRGYEKWFVDSWSCSPRLNFLPSTDRKGVKLESLDQQVGVDAIKVGGYLGWLELAFCW